MRRRSQSESPWGPSQKAQDKQFPQLKLNHIAPNFHALSSHGPIELYEYLSTHPEPYNPDETTKATANATDGATKGGSWVVFFSYPMDSTLACTTEVASMAELQGEFAKRGAKLLGLTIGTVEQHRDWMREIRKFIEAGGTHREKNLLNFPIIADEDGYVSQLYGMLEDPGEATEVEHLRTVRSLFVIDPNRHIRLITAYPDTTGGDTAEILRALDALKRSDQAGVLTPEGWTVGDEIVVPPEMTHEDAEKKFGKGR
ncbi:thioredoxin-like protein [Terfezia boudieri ATCC MYA-4762]|uniref:Thioredoxin-like protein n=1 Tax=Terfezia boudieri ATCC MYA-4762 TaxID=1051890 RepID=A0A3N4M1I8_9PEZI|nr:thioredoxin-like protein [Terfezia boudieri ATCC MYA-4762]